MKLVGTSSGMLGAKITYKPLGGVRWFGKARSLLHAITTAINSLHLQTRPYFKVGTAYTVAKWPGSDGEGPA